MSASVPPAPPGRYRGFFLWSLFFALTLGSALGAAVLATATLPRDFLLGIEPAAARAAHGYAQVFGFTALFVMGVAYHTLPRFKGAMLAAPGAARGSLWLQVGGLLAIMAGLAMRGRGGSVLMTTGAAALLGGAAAFAWVVDRTLASGAPTVEGLEPHLRAGSAWLVIAAALAVAAAAGWPSLQPAVWEAGLWGFAGSWIVGMSLRILPLFGGLPPVRTGQWWLWAIYQSGVLLWVAVAAIEARVLVPWMRVLAGAVLGGATMFAVLRLGPVQAIFRGPRHARSAERVFFATAYAWWAIAAALGPLYAAACAWRGAVASSQVLDFARHAFTLGFLTQMIVGVASRVIPVFTGKGLWSARWRAATYGLLNGAVAVRALQVVVDLGGFAAPWPLVAISGPLGFAAFLTFAVNVAMTGRGRGAAAAVAPAGLSADAPLAEILRLPGAVEVLVAQGLESLRDPALRAGMARTVTLRQACRIHERDVEGVLEALRARAGEGREPPGKA